MRRLTDFNLTFMKKFIAIAAALLCSFTLLAQEKTLRVDYVFSGTDKASEISLDRMYSFDGWAGRRVNLDKVPVKGNGQISMTDAATGKVVYRLPFSTLFQEWQTSDEARFVRKSFENTFLLPMPSSKAVVKVELFDSKGVLTASLKHVVDPSDILIRHLKPVSPEHRYLLKSGDPAEKIDVAVVAEGYTVGEMDKFYEHAQVAVDAILAHAPFDRYKDRFNFVAVALESKDSGVSVPREDLWLDTAVGRHYDTFYMDRYLTTTCVNMMHDKLAGIPYEHLVVLANTDTYGGGGIFNSYTLTTALHPAFKPVVVHEFGHSFAGLGDEYYYESEESVAFYHADSEPWEQNITTLYDFGSKWDDMRPKVIHVPTPAPDVTVWSKIEDGAAPESLVGVYEGGGYQTKGVYRPYPDCRMKTNGAPMFCPVCQRAIARIIEFYTE